MKLQIIQLAFFSILIVLGTSCKSNKPSGPVKYPQTSEKKIWMSIDPIQCLGNPWDKMVDRTAKDTREAEKQAMFKYYGQRGIIVYDYGWEQTHEFVCEACDCPRGDTINLYVKEEDIGKMRSMGFRLIGEKVEKE